MLAQEDRTGCSWRLDNQAIRDCGIGAVIRQSCLAPHEFVGSEGIQIRLGRAGAMQRAAGGLPFVQRFGKAASQKHDWWAIGVGEASLRHAYELA